MSAAPAIKDMAVFALDPRLSEADRVELIRALGSWGTDEARTPLVQALKDPSPAIREAAAGALGMPEHRAASGALRDRLLAPDEDVAVRATAARSLGLIGDMAVRDAMLRAARDPQREVRQSALWGLTLAALQRPDDRVPLLIELASDRAFEAAVRVEALQALGQSHAASAAPAVARMLSAEPATPLALPPPNPNQQEVMLIRHHQARAVRAWAADTLGRLNARDEVPLLLRLAEDPGDFFLRFMALRVLLSWNVPEAIPVFVRRLEDPFEDNQLIALRALAMSGDQAAIAPVRRRLSDASARVRMFAVVALAELGGKGVVPELQALQARETDPHVMRTLEATLTRVQQ